jgi:hypothetical protein
LPDWSLWRTIYYLDTIPRIANSYVFPEANEDTSFWGKLISAIMVVMVVSLIG